MEWAGTLDTPPAARKGARPPSPRRIPVRSRSDARRDRPVPFVGERREGGWRLAALAIRSRLQGSDAGEGRRTVVRRFDRSSGPAIALQEPARRPGERPAARDRGAHSASPTAWADKRSVPGKSPTNGRRTRPADRM